MSTRAACDRYAWIEQIGADAAQRWIRSDGDVTVAILDSGVDVGDPFLRPWIRDDGKGGWDFVLDRPSGAGIDAHGTAIAAIVRQITGYTGSRIRLMPLRVCTDGSPVPPGRVAQAIHFAIDHRVDIINASLWWPGGDAAVDAAIARAADMGILIVAAAGNDGVNLRRRPRSPAAFGLTHSNVLTVQGVGDEQHPVRSDFASGVSLLAAPASCVCARTWASAPDLRFCSRDSSAAAAIVSGAAALLRTDLRWVQHAREPARLAALLLDNSRAVTVPALRRFGQQRFNMIDLRFLGSAANSSPR